MRLAECTPIADADVFFADLAEKVMSLEEIDRVHPLASKVAVATLKRYLAEDRHRIRAHDLLMEATDDTCRKLDHIASTRIGGGNDADFVLRIREYDGVIEPMLGLLAATAYWGEQMHVQWLLRSISRVSTDRGPTGGITAWLDLQRYPLLLVLYAAGLGALARERYDLLAGILMVPSADQGMSVPALMKVSPNRTLKPEHASMLFAEVPRARPYAASEHLRDVLRNPRRDIIAADTEYETIFDRFEYLYGLIQADQYQQIKNRVVGMIGLYASRRLNSTYDPLKELDAQIAAHQADLPLLKAGLFGGSLDRLQTIKAVVDGHARKTEWW